MQAEEKEASINADVRGGVAITSCPLFTSRIELLLKSAPHKL